MSTIRELAEEAITDADDLRAQLRAQMRGLVESGGRPYIKITVVNPETGEVGIEHHGFEPDLDLPGALREIADLIESTWLDA